jgi:hypothetical protein
VPFVPGGFDVPRGLTAEHFRLEPLGPQHNESDHAAWMSSIEHVRATPGYEGHDWPPPDGMSPEANRADLEAHARDFEDRTGFTYTVLEPGAGAVIGCVYIYPARDGGGGAHVRSWVRSDRAPLDAELHAAVSAWLAADWPFERVLYAARNSR